MTNEDVLNDVMRKTFPKTIFIRSINEGNKTQAIHFSEEWLNEEYSTESAFEGMTHRDVLKALFPIDENKGARLTKVYIDHEPIESFALTTTQKWLDSPYKGVSE